MQKFIEVTGKNDEEALAKGLKMLGMDRDDVSLEILERGRTGFLGIGSVPAKIRLTYEAPDEPEPVKPAPEPVKPVSVKPESPKPAASRVRDSADKWERKPVQPRRREPRPQPQSPNPPRPQAKARPVEAEVPTTAASIGADPDVIAAIVAFQKGLFEHMDVQAEPSVSFDGQAYLVTLEGPELGPLIGHRGETLDAIQQLTGYAVNKNRSHRVRIHVDAEGYRARREETLTRLAQKTAGKAIRYRRSMALEPMNAYERHVIHTALQDYPGVSTRSTGVEPNRRVIVNYDP